MNVVEVYNRVRCNWKIILVGEIISIILGLIIIFSIPKEFTSSIVLAPETKDKGSSSGLLAGLFENIDQVDFGDIGYATTKDAIYPKLYPIIFESPTYAKSFFDIKVPFEGRIITFREYAEHDLKYPWWSNIGKLLFPKKEEVENNSSLSPFELTQEDWQILRILQDRVNLILDKKTYVMTISVTTQDPLISAIVADSVGRILTQTITNYRTAKAKSNLSYIQTVYKEAQVNYLESQTKYRKFQDTHTGLNKFSERVKGDELKAEADISLAILIQVTKQLQMAKSKVEEEIPVFAILEPAVVMPKPSYPSKAKCLLGFILVGTIISIWYIFK